MTKYASGNIMKRGASYSGGSGGAMETANTTGPMLDLGNAGVAHIECVVSAVQGTSPTLLLTFEGSSDSVNWYTLGVLGANGLAVGLAAAPTNITGPGTYRGVLPVTQFFRRRSTIGGSAGPGVNYTLSIETNSA